MARLSRIEEGMFLHLGSSVGSPSNTLHNAIERPYIVPVWDPEGSIIPPPSATLRQSTTSVAVGIPDACVLNGNGGRAVKPLSNHRSVGPAPSPYNRNYLGISSPSFRESRIRMTPSSIYRGVEQHQKPLEVPGQRVTDRGSRAWAHVFAGLLVVFNAQGLNMSYGVFQAYYQLNMPDKTPASIAWIGSFQIFFLFFMSLFVSPMMDKGYFRYCFNGGSFLLVLSIFATSFCKTLTQLIFVQGILTGVAMGLIYASGVMVLWTYFTKYLGVATGIGAAGGSLGGMIYPLISKNLILTVGYPWTVRTIAFVAMFTLIPANVIVRERPNRLPKKAITMDWTIIHDGPYLMMMAGMFFSFWGIYFGFYYIVSYADSILNLPSSSSVNLLVAMNAANLPGRFIPGLISDSCIGPVNTIVPSVFFAAMQVFAWIGITNQGSLFIIACFYGFAAGGVQSLYNATILRFAIAGPTTSNPNGDNGNEQSNVVGIRLALVYVVIGLACLTGAPVGGALIQAKGGDFLYAQLFAGTSITVGGAFLLGARLWKAGWEAQRL